MGRREMTADEAADNDVPDFGDEDMLDAEDGDDEAD